MRQGNWVEIADVSSIECVGIVKSCPGGEFAPGTRTSVQSSKFPNPSLRSARSRTIRGTQANAGVREKGK